jgi:hypothetical protein
MRSTRSRTLYVCNRCGRSVELEAVSNGPKNLPDHWIQLDETVGGSGERILIHLCTICVRRFKQFMNRKTVEDMP